MLSRLFFPYFPLAGKRRVSHIHCVVGRSDFSLFYTHLNDPFLRVAIQIRVIVRALDSHLLVLLLHLILVLAEISTGVTSNLQRTEA